MQGRLESRALDVSADRAGEAGREGRRAGRQRPEATRRCSGETGGQAAAAGTTTRRREPQRAARREGRVAESTAVGSWGSAEPAAVSSVVFLFRPVSSAVFFFVLFFFALSILVPDSQW